MLIFTIRWLFIECWCYLLSTKPPILGLYYYYTIDLLFGRLDLSSHIITRDKLAGGRAISLGTSCSSADGPLGIVRSCFAIKSILPEQNLGKIELNCNKKADKTKLYWLYREDVLKVCYWTKHLIWFADLPAEEFGSTKSGIAWECKRPHKVEQLYYNIWLATNHFGFV